MSNEYKIKNRDWLDFNLQPIGLQPIALPLSYAPPSLLQCTTSLHVCLNTVEFGWLYIYFT